MSPSTHAAPSSHEVPSTLQDGRAAASAAKDHVRKLLGGDHRVNGVGLTRWHSAYVVRVNVVDERDAPDLPDTVDGVPVQVVEVGRITTQPHA